MSDDRDDDRDDDLLDDESSYDDDTEDSSDDGYDDDSSDDSPSDKLFKFDISAEGEVTAFYEYDDGVWELEDIGAKDTFVLNDDGTITHTEVKRWGSEVTTYAATEVQGEYLRISEQWVGTDTPPNDNPVPALAQVLRYLSTDDDDYIAVRDGFSCDGGLGSDQFVVREGGDLRIEDFDRSQGDKLVFDTGLGLLSKDQLIGYVTSVSQEGDDLVVQFGDAATITLVGVTLDDIGWDDVLCLS